MAQHPTRYSLPATGLTFTEYFSAHNVYHPGYDYNFGSGWDDYQQEVMCAAKGTIEYISPKSSWQNASNGGFGNFVIVYHGRVGKYTRYAHMDSVVTGLKVGDSVNEGQVIGRVGNTGTGSPHLHFEVFGEEIAEIQRAHWRKWCYYPSGKSKTWITARYKDPFVWIDELNADELMPEWAMEAADKAKSTGIVTDQTNPNKPVNDMTIAWSLRKAGVLDKDPTAPLTLAQWLVVLDRLKLLDK